MHKTELVFAVQKKNNVVTSVGKSIILQPPIKQKEHHINWFDDSKLLRGIDNDG